MSRQASSALRVATPDDSDAIDALMKASARALFPQFYDEERAASAIRYVPEVNAALLEDGTYFVRESGGEAVACALCGSEPQSGRILEECEAAARRKGFSQLFLVATPPGVPLYVAYGLRAIDELELPDGVRLPCLAMEKPIDPL